MIRILPVVFFLFANVAPAADDYSTSTALPVLPPVQPGPPYLEAGPMLGHISANDARVWVKATGQTAFSVAVSGDPAFANPRVVQGPELLAESGFAGHLLLPDLKPATRYFYSVHLGAESQSTRPLPSFVTAPANGTRGITRFGFGSCVGKDGALDAATWADMEARGSIDFFLLLGDNHYANSADPVKQRAAFVAHRRNPGFLAFTRRTPLYGIWDDHDYGPNDSDGTLPEKERALATFKQFFANPAYGEADNPGVYFALQRGDIDIFLLDGRYHRTPNKTVDDGTKTMLGAKQLAWLKRELLASKATIKFIASGSEWQTYSAADCWPSFARERREILDHLNQHAIRNVVFLSGDRHMTAAYQIEGRHLEVTSGPLGSPNSRVTKPSPETILYRDSGKLYCVFDVNTAHEPPQLALEIYRAGDGLVEKRIFTWDEVTGAAKITPLGKARP